MTRFQIPHERLKRYRLACIESTVAHLQVAANLAQDDFRALVAAGEDDLAAGAAIHMLWCILMRAAAPAGCEGAPAMKDVLAKEGAACAFDEMGEPVSAAMIRAAARHDRERLFQARR